MSELYDLLDRAHELPKHSPVAVELIQRAVRIADAEGNVRGGFEARDDLCARCLYLQTWDRFFVAFAWMLARHDEDPTTFPGTRLLWYYKWAVNNAMDDHRVPAARMDALLADLEARLLRAGYSLRPLHQHWMYYDRRRGELDAATRRYELFKDAPRDRLADCTVCELNGAAKTLDVIGRRDEALETWRAVLAHRRPCEMVPAVTHAAMLLPLLERGDVESARQHHRDGYAAVRHTSYLGALSEHLAFEARWMENETAVVDLIEAHLPSALTQLPGVRWEFLRATAFGLSRLAATGRRTIPIRLPSAPLFDDLAMDAREPIEIAPLLARVDDEAQRIARCFDERHQNTYWTDKDRAYATRWLSTQD